MGFPAVSASKESAFNAGDLGLIPGLGRSPEEEKGKYYITHMWSLKHDTKGLIYKADTDLQILRTDLWFAKERQVRKG